ncbi:membrane hypothetical protein [Pseudomonas sp. 8BK]|nr:membrane hypothetical protein [Pseudomonas sp. 8BK]
MVIFKATFSVLFHAILIALFFSITGTIVGFLAMLTMSPPFAFHSLFYAPKVAFLFGAIYSTIICILTNKTNWLNGTATHKNRAILGGGIALLPIFIFANGNLFTLSILAIPAFVCGFLCYQYSRDSLLFVFNNNSTT